MRISTGGDPVRVWRDVLRSHRLVPTWILCTLVEVERRRLALGWSNDKLSEAAKLADRSYLKYLRPWRRSARPYKGRPVKNPGCGGRIPTMDTLRKLVKAIERGDRLGPLDVKPVAMTRAEYERKLDNLAVRHQRNGPYGRTLLVNHMRALVPLGVAGRRAKLSADDRRRVASLGAVALNAKRTPEQRSAAAQAAAYARWGTAPRPSQESARFG